MSNEHTTSLGDILAKMKDEHLHIVRQRPSMGTSQIFTLHHNDDGARTTYGPYSISVLQELLDGGFVEQDRVKHDQGCPIYRPTIRG